MNLKHVSLTINGHNILQDINLHVNKGEFCVITGPNGCGKSSLLKIIQGIYKPTSGLVHVPQKVATLHQNVNDNLFQDLTIFETLKLLNIKDPDDILHLPFHTKIKNLSGGQKQLLALMLRLKMRPDILLLDEHTSALDPKMADYVMAYTYKAVREQNVTCLMVTHNMKHAENFRGHHILMEEGRMRV